MGRPMGRPMGIPMRRPMGRPTGRLGIPMGRAMGRSMGRPLGIPMGLFPGLPGLTVGFCLLDFGMSTRFFGCRQCAQVDKYVQPFLLLPTVLALRLVFIKLFKVGP